jgi:ribosomal protein S12 methylthiotransferase
MSPSRDTAVPPTGLPRVGLVSLGCSKNTVDSEVLLAKLDRSGFTLTRRAEEAEVLIVNTCGFIDAAKRESIETILEMATHKEQGACRQLLVVGCLSQRYGAELRESLPEVDAFFGTEQQDVVLDYLLQSAGRAARRPSAAVTGPRDDAPPRLLISGGPSAYLKISEGCNHTCSFCVIPNIRGRHLSRPIESLVREAHSLADQGVRELCVISQDTAYYGLDLGLLHGLELLLDRLNEVDGIDWIRLHYLYPASIRLGLVERFARLSKLAPYVDMPVQHGADAVLKRMRRPDTRRSLEALVRQLRDAVPGISIRTTIIVGFPGETDEDFAELLDFVDTCQFDHLGVFSYSDEEDSRALSLPDKVPSEVAGERQERLLAVQQEVSRERLQRFLGRTERVLVESWTKQGLAVGRTAHQARDVDGVTFVRGSTAVGQFVDARIQRTLDYDLMGTAIDSAAGLICGSESPSAAAPVLIPLAHLTASPPR